MKIKKLIIACLVFVSALFTASCSKPTTPVNPLDNHQHNYILTEFKGNVTHHWNVCAFDGCTRKGNTEEHRGGTATCTARPVCEVCGLSYGSLAAHNYTEQVVSDKYLAVAANCQSPAQYFYSCVCGAKGSETFEGTGLGEHVLSESYEGSATGHYHSCTIPNCDHKSVEESHELETVIETATCTEAGIQYQVCDICGWETPENERTILDPIPHLYSTVVVIQSPTTSYTGSGKISCSYGCGKSEVITLPAINTTNYSKSLVEGEGALNDRLSLTTASINNIANSLTTISAEDAKVGLELFGFDVVTSSASGYKATLNGEFFTPTSRPVQDPQNKAELLLTLNRADVFKYYYNGGLISSYKAPLDGEYIVYVNSENICYPGILEITSTVEVKLDEQDATYMPMTPSSGNLFQYVLNATEGQKLEIIVDGEPITFGETNLKYFTVPTTSEYTVFINNDILAYIVDNVNDYKNLTVSASEEDLTNTAVFVWAWETNKDGSWYFATVNSDGTITVKIPVDCDNMLIAKFPYGTTNPSWDSCINQTEDIKLSENKTEYAPSWKGGSSGGVAGAFYYRGTIGGVDNWNTLSDALNLKNTDGTHTIIVTLKANDQFKIATNDWSTEYGYNSLTDKTGFSETGAYGGDIKVSQDGTYLITLKDGKLTITKQ